MEPANRRNAIRDDRLDAIAEAFVFDRHQCAEGEILAPWRENTDEASAAQAIARWRLDEGYSQWWEEFARDPSHMERNGYGAADLAAASRGSVPTGGCGVSLVSPVPAARIVEAEGIRRPTGPALG